PRPPSSPSSQQAVSSHCPSSTPRCNGMQRLTSISDVGKVLLRRQRPHTNFSRVGRKIAGGVKQITIGILKLCSPLWESPRFSPRRRQSGENTVQVLIALEK